MKDNINKCFDMIPPYSFDLAKIVSNESISNYLSVCIYYLWFNLKQTLINKDCFRFTGEFPHLSRIYTNVYADLIKIIYTTIPYVFYTDNVDMICYVPHFLDF